MNKYIYYIIPIVALLLIVPFTFHPGRISPRTTLQIISGTFTGKIVSADIFFFVIIGILPYISLISLFVPSLIKKENWKKIIMILFTIVNVIVLLGILFAFLIGGGPI